MISDYQVKAAKRDFAVDDKAIVTRPIDGGSAFSAQGVGIVPSICSFRFIICWRYKVNDRRWPNREIPYSYGSSITDSQRIAINNAISIWNSKINQVQYRYRPTAASRVEFTAFTFKNPSTRGDSYVGRINPYQYQILRLNPNIFNTSITSGVIQHEMSHAAGMIHEHQRCDRNKYVYVTVNDSNYTPDCSSAVQTYTPYDYSSVMHYGPAVNGVFTPISPQPAGTLGSTSDIGQRRGLSAGDITTINSIYR